MATLLTQLPFKLKFTATVPLRERTLPPRTAGRVVVSVSSPQRRTRKKKQQAPSHPQKAEDDGGGGGALMASGTEKVLRLVFMEELMERARNADASGVSEVIYDMIAAGLYPGPRSFHGLIVSHVLNLDVEGAVTLFPPSLLCCVCECLMKCDKLLFFCEYRKCQKSLFRFTMLSASSVVLLTMRIPSV